MIKGWVPNEDSSYQEIFVPTVDITRNKILIQGSFKK